MPAIIEMAVNICFDADDIALIASSCWYRVDEIVMVVSCWWHRGVIVTVNMLVNQADGIVPMALSY